VMSPHYPALKNARELAAPLIYLMKGKNYDKMMAIQDPDSLKAAVDRFWLKHIKNKNKARDVLKKYYARVEEANKQFSDFKEGWKTDPGRIYILFGPPWYVYQHVDQMKWSYAYNQEEFDRNFYFHQPKLKSKYYPFEHYILVRNQNYFTTAYQQRQLWLTGLILQRQL
jgi:GWxTD domain-containing protein